MITYLIITSQKKLDEGRKRSLRNHVKRLMTRYSEIKRFKAGIFYVSLSEYPKEYPNEKEKEVFKQSQARRNKEKEACFELLELLDEFEVPYLLFLASFIPNWLNLEKPYNLF